MTSTRASTVDDKVIPIWNTYGVIPGRLTDEVVVIGNHRDGECPRQSRHTHDYLCIYARSVGEYTSALCLTHGPCLLERPGYGSHRS